MYSELHPLVFRHPSRVGTTSCMCSGKQDDVQSLFPVLQKKYDPLALAKWRHRKHARRRPRRPCRSECADGRDASFDPDKELAEPLDSQGWRSRVKTIACGARHSWRGALP